MLTRKPHILGKSQPRFEGALKVTGGARYLNDLDFGPGVLCARLLYSPHPHALIRQIDVSATRALPGVKAVITGADVAGRLGLYLKDRRVLAGSRVRYVGEPVAAVAAESPEVAEQALALIRVDYAPLPVVEDVEQALAPDAPLIHPHIETYPRAPFVSVQPGSNIAHVCRMEQGDVAQGFAEADVVVEHSYDIQRVQHLSMETHGCVARVDGEGHCTLWVSTQAPFVQREIICQALGLAPEQLQVLTPYVGGSFGGKRHVLIEAIAVALAFRCPGHAVKLVLSRPEELTASFQRPGLHAWLKMGAREDGTLTAIEAVYHWNLGASADATLQVLRAAALAGTGPYRIPHSRVESYGVYTNQPVASPMRGNGMAELHWAVEQHVERMAQALGMSPLQFRLRNLIRGGDPLVDGRTMHATGLHTCLRKVAMALEKKSTRPSEERPGLAPGHGLAVMWNPVLADKREIAKATVQLDAENRCSVYLSGVDFGQGIHTLAAQILVSELGVLPEWVRVLPFETRRGHRNAQVAYNHLTWRLGNALLQAAHSLKHQVLAYVAERWAEPRSHLDIIDGMVVSYGSNRSLELEAVLAGALEGEEAKGGCHFESVGTFSLQPTEEEEEAGGWSLMVRYMGTGAVAAEVLVDPQTGVVKVTKIAAAYDVGHALNPDVVNAQIKGGVMQGLSTTLLEQLPYEHGVPQRRTMREYKIASILDLPEEIIPIIVEVPQENGPFGARGIGEHTTVAVAPAIANAIADAVGVRVDCLPITAEHLWQLLRQAQPEADAC
ncbi:MAG: xanthine dehydrogenase family protein molybdopterin-binding subunit [Chloroflexi bacterium]|nr:MAG: xanthine dehydrogenase family protein molybdopterin-binding subunit [Chloroflexota bacterium]